MQRVWKGKGGGRDNIALERGVVGKSLVPVYDLDANKRVTQATKEQLVRERMNWERDLRLIEREYDDEYDDQVCRVLLVYEARYIICC